MDVVVLQELHLVYFCQVEAIFYKVKLIQMLCGKSVLRSNLQSDGSLVTREYTGYGIGIQIYPNLSSIKINDGSDTNIAPITFCDGTNKRKTFKIFSDLLSEFYGTDKLYALNTGWKWGDCQLVIAALGSFPPN